MPRKKGAVDPKVKTAQDFVNVEDIADNILFSRDGYIFGYLSIRAGDTKLLTEEERIAKGASLASAMGVEREPWQILSIPRTVDTAGMIERLAGLRKATQEDAQLKLLNGEITALQGMAREGSKEPLIVFKAWAKAARGADQELMKRLRDVRSRLADNGVAAEAMGDTDITYLCKVFADLTSYHDAGGTAFAEEIPLLRGKPRRLKADGGTNAGLLNLITPVGGLSFGVSKTTVGGVVGRIYGAQRYPAELDYGWAVDVMNSSDCITSLTYIPGNASELGDALSRSIKQNATEADSERDARKRKQHERQALDADKLIESLDFNSAPVGHLTWLVMPFTDDEEKLDDTCRAVLNRYARKRIKLKVLGSVQRDAYKQLSPYYTNQPNVDGIMQHLFPLETLMGGSPMTVNIYRDANGVYFAKTMDGSIISLDFLYRGTDRTNGNIIAVGQAGSGKSTALKSILESLYMLGVKIIVIDPEREFRDLCRNLHGAWLDIGGGASKVNLFQVREAPEDEEGEEDGLYQGADNALALHMRTLEMVFKLYLPGLTSVQQSLLMRAVQDVYRDKGITWETDLKGLEAAQYPTAADLHKLLEGRAKEDPRYKGLESLTFSMACGPDSFLLNGYTNVDLGNNFIVLDTNRLQNSSEKLKRTQYMNMLAMCWDYMARDREQPVFLLCDEAHILLDPTIPEPAMYLRNLCKRARKYEGLVGIVTQSVSDLLDERIKLQGQAIMDNSSYKLLFTTDGQNLKDTTKLFNLTEAEQNIILNCGRGKALTLIGRQHVYVDFDLPQYRLDLMGKGGGR